VTAADRAVPAHEALALNHITKRFGATTAVDDVSLVVRKGTVHALLGENGAGKTTLMRVAFGLLRPDHGDVVVDGRPVDLRSAADAIDAGVGMVHQHFTNVPAMTVAENVALGHTGRYDRETAAARVREIGRRTGLMLEPSALARDLPVGAQQRLEILKALGRDARTLILDEPTAVLAPDEAHDLLSWLRAFARGDNAIVLITHKLHEALSVADEVTVLRHGRAVFNAPAAGLEPERLALELLGEAPAKRERIGAAAPGVTVARLEQVAFADARGVTKLRDVSLTIQAGEIVGVAAVEGAGQHELLRLLASRARATTGAVVVPSDVAFVPEDRHRDAIILDFPARDNVALKGAGARRGRMPWARLGERTATLVRAFDVRGVRLDGAASIGELSGGNQQKFVLGRELDGEPRLVVAENPTRGLDIRASADVHDRLREAAHGGAAVIVYSSDLDEVLSLATRVVVLHGGRLREISGDRETVGRAMLGVA
jgi:simple sugar transport system ATP-binding protein